MHLHAVIRIGYELLRRRLPSSPLHYDEAHMHLQHPVKKTSAKQRWNLAELYRQHAEEDE